MTDAATNATAQVIERQLRASCHYEHLTPESREYSSSASNSLVIDAANLIASVTARLTELEAPVRTEPAEKELNQLATRFAVASIGANAGCIEQLRAEIKDAALDSYVVLARPLLNRATDAETRLAEAQARIAELERNRRDGVGGQAAQESVDIATTALKHSIPDDLREAGWSVAVHNDYRVNGERMTFWLFTHSNGRWIKGEGYTDAEALTECRARTEKGGAAFVTNHDPSSLTQARILADYFERNATRPQPVEPLATEKGGDAFDGPAGRTPETTPQPVEPPAGASYPVGEIKSEGQLIAELNIAADRMEISGGVLKDWSNRFRVLRAALLARAPSPTGELPAGAVTTEELDLAQFGRSLHKRPWNLIADFVVSNCDELRAAARARARAPTGEPSDAAVEAAALAIHRAFWRRAYKDEVGTATVVARDTWEANKAARMDEARHALVAAARLREPERRARRVAALKARAGKGG